MKKVVVGLSGGVDSSVAAHLLIEAGYDVVGMFMKNWHDTSVTISDECPWEDDANDALLVAEHLGIPFHTIDLSEEYRLRIVEYMFSEYENGRTPNPDVLCNREIKFDVFLKAALKLGADYVATGHYCRKTSFKHNGDEVQQLLSGLDPNKDQSYFLCQVNQYQLSKTLFPIGELQKSEVRAIAERIGLPTAAKKDSQGLCFIGKVKLPDFLKQKLEPKTGSIMEVASDDAVFTGDGDSLEEMAAPYDFDLERCKPMGEHQGAHYFTIGQRKGLNVGGTPEPLFVIGTDTTSNVIYVGQGEQHPGLSRKALKILNKDVHWVRPDLSIDEDQEMDVWCRIRYRQTLVKAKLKQTADALFIVFDLPMKSITPGQFAAWYLDDELIGSGVIYS